MLVSPKNYEREPDVSSENEPLDSDQIDSDVEAELYSVLHHEDSFLSINTSNNEISALCLNNESFHISYTSFEESRQTSLINHSDNNISITEISKTDNLLADEHNRNLCDTFDNNGYVDNIYDSTISGSYKSPEQNQAFRDSFNTCSSSSKCKSDSESSIFEVESMCKKTKINKQNIPNGKLSKTVSILSSSEDDDIICIEPSNNQEKLETNVSQVVLLDSDSDSSDSWTFKFVNRNITSTPSVSKTKDLWHVNDDDVYRSRRTSNRYHDSLLTCNLCHQKGHSHKFCSFARGTKCFICGNQHNSLVCKKRICAKCFQNNHDMRNCSVKVRVCELCKMLGHHAEYCPDLWRRFQRSTTELNQEPAQVCKDTPVFCYNCGVTGHFGGLCLCRNTNITPFQTWPFVLNFKVATKPTASKPTSEERKSRKEKLRKKRERKQKKKKLLSSNAENVIVQEVVNPDIQQISLPKSSEVNQISSKSPKPSKKEPIWLKFKKASIAKKKWRKEQKRKMFQSQHFT